MKERPFYEPKAADVVVVVANQRWVSLTSLEGAGIDVLSPFLVWADRATGTVFARQSLEMVGPHPARLFEGVRSIAGIADEGGDRGEAEMRWGSENEADDCPLCGEALECPKCDADEVKEKVSA